MSVDRSVFSFRSARGSASAELKNTPRSVACKRAHDALATKKLPASKWGRRAGEQHFDSPHGFFDMRDASARPCPQKFFGSCRARMHAPPYFPGPAEACRLSLYMSANFLAQIFT